MARALVSRRKFNVKARHLTAGLTTQDNPDIANKHTIVEAQNIAVNNYVIGRRDGWRYWCDEISTQRGTGIYQWKPLNERPKDKLYMTTAASLYRLTKTPSSSPLFTSSEVSQPTGFEWSFAEKTSMIGWGRYMFAFNGVNVGYQIDESDPDTAVPFMFEAPNAPTAALDGAGNVDGTYWYQLRYVKEVQPEVREYWGAYSDYVAITAANNQVEVSYDIPTDSQVDAIYVYRSADGGGTPFYHARIDKDDFDGTYTDNTAATNTIVYHGDVLSRISGMKYVCRDNNRLILYSANNQTTQLYWSEPDYPQEFRAEGGNVNEDVFNQGSGLGTGCISYRGNLYLFREKGIGVFQVDANGDYVPISFWDSFGCIAPDTIKSIRTKQGDIVTFLDSDKGLCIIDGNEIKSLMEVEKYVGFKELATTDIEDVIKNQMSIYRMDKASVGYFNEEICLFYTPRYEQFNTACVRYNLTKKAWSGPDTGMSVGPCINRIDGYGISGGAGELLACRDAQSARVIQLYYGTRDNTAVIQAKAKTIRLGLTSTQWKEWYELKVNAKIAKTLRVDIEAYNGYFHSFYLIHGGGVVYNGGFHFDSGHGFDDTSIPLFDDGKMYDAGVEFGAMAWRQYNLRIPSPNQGIWCQVRFFWVDGYPAFVGGYKLSYVERGEL